MAFLWEENTNGYGAAGYRGEVSHLILPEQYEERPVNAVEKSAFARRSDLIYVSLPGTVERIARFAFYDCPNLSKIVLTDHVLDVYDGAFRRCPRLLEAEVTIRQGRFTILRDLLTEIDHTLCLYLHLPRGDARLIFPDYLQEYQEDTWARAIHMNIEGAGFAYRECISRSSLDFRAYDASFSRIRRINPSLAAQIAMERLLFPYALEPAAEAQYTSFLRDPHPQEALREAIARRREDWIRLLLQRNLLSPAVLREGITYAREQGETALVSLLMQAVRSTEPTKRNRLTLT